VELELAAYFTELIAIKRAEPDDHLVSALVVALGNAGPPAPLTYPGEMARLRQDPSLLPAGEWVLPAVSSANRDLA
jgi:hypothetical protein